MNWKKWLIGTVILIIGGLLTFGNQMSIGQNQSRESIQAKKGKILIIYYSQTGQTKRIAELLKDKMDADSYEIVIDRKYNSDMWKAAEEAQQELATGNLPKLQGELPDVSKYDVILIGGPVWSHTLSNPILSYLRQTNFDGKTVSSFWTFYNRDEKYNEDMKKEIKGTKVLDGLSLPRSITEDKEKLDQAINAWLGKLIH